MIFLIVNTHCLCFLQSRQITAIFCNMPHCSLLTFLQSRKHKTALERESGGAYYAPIRCKHKLHIEYVTEGDYTGGNPLMLSVHSPLLSTTKSTHWTNKYNSAVKQFKFKYKVTLYSPAVKCGKNRNLFTACTNDAKITHNVSQAMLYFK